MSVRRLAEEQPASFEFTPENLAWANAQIVKYPEGRQASAVIPLLWQAQKQHNYWLPKPAIEKVADMLDMPYIRVLEIATFYTMFNLEPVGRFFIQMCGTTPCMLRGSDDIKAVLSNLVQLYQKYIMFKKQLALPEVGASHQPDSACTAQSSPHQMLSWDSFMIQS